MPIPVRLAYNGELKAIAAALERIAAASDQMHADLAKLTALLLELLEPHSAVSISQKFEQSPNEGPKGE